MEKPSSVLIRETEEEIIKVINSSNLPPFCIRKMLEPMIEQLRNLENEEIANYYKKLEEKKEKEKSKESDK